MRILMFVSNDVVHDTRVLKEARALIGAGHDVTAVGWDRGGSLPATDEVDGLKVHRVRTKGALRILASDVLRNPVWWRTAQGLAKGLEFDVLHCHDLDTLPIGVRLKRVTGKPLVYDCHEVFGYMIEENVPRIVVDYAFRMERRLAPSADWVISVNDAVKEYIDGVTRKPSVVVRNVQDLAAPKYRPPPGPPFTLLYIGTLHESRFILPAIEVVAGMPGVRAIIGGGKKLAPQVAALCAKSPNTSFVGLVPNEKVLPMTIDSHAVLSMFDPTYRINQVGVSNKVYEAMAAGRPVIVTRGLMMGDLVEREECGLVVPYTKEGLRSAIAQLQGDPALAERLGRRGFDAAKREYNWALEKRRLLDVYAGIPARG